ncbi:helix-turn-helix domain-containing protein [Acidobacteriia bacterium AH_259_A11_L15]|nr:helix-turn-helix domain-containing protein [Acidobacteriia bacterium AH_259_A11_L15]
MTTQDVLAVDVSEAARRLGVSPRTVATLVARKELLSRRIGRRRVIPVASLEAFLRRDHATGQEKAHRR